MAGLPKHYGVLLFNDFATLDVMGPLGMLRKIPDVQIHRIHDTLSPIRSGKTPENWTPSTVFAGELYVPTCTMDTAPPLDALIVPGGFGTRGLGSDKRWEQFVAKQYPNLKYLLSICTGASIIGRSGILDGRRATTNKAAFAWVKTQGPNVDWVAEARWVVDGNIWSSSGVEAGTDMTFAFVKQVYGEALAESLANTLELIPSTDPTFDPFAAVYGLSSTSVAPPAPAPSSFPLPDGQTSRWGVLVYPGFVTLDMISVTIYPETISFQPGFQCSITLIGPSSDEPVVSYGNPPFYGPGFMATKTYTDAPADLDVLIVPGLPEAGPFPQHDELVAYLKAAYPKVKHIISVGTGSMLLAAAGILNGRKATTAKAHWDPATAPFRGDGREISWTTGRWVRDGNVWTASGTASGLDAGNALCIKLFGETPTHKAAVLMEYTPHTDSSHDPFAKIWGVRST